MKIRIGDIIKSKRTALGISQEKLAEKMGVTVQAVSKWENGLSCPDIALLPDLAEYFGITIDYLLTGKSNALLPDDGVFRVVQAIGNKVLDKTEYKADKEIKMNLPDTVNPTFNVEIWGSLNLANGDIIGNVSCGNSVTCTNVGGNVDCGGDTTCADVGGSVDCGGDITCADVGGPVKCGGDITCADVGGPVKCGGNMYCTDK